MTAMSMSKTAGLCAVAALCFVVGLNAAQWLQSGGADDAVAAAATRANGAANTGIPSIGRRPGQP